MSGAAGDAKAAGGSAPTSAAGGRADNGGNVTQAAQKGATPDQPSDIESPAMLPQIVVVAETRAERLARKAMGRDAWTLFGIQGSTALVGGGVAAAPEIAAMFYANGEKIVGAGVLTLEALAGDAVGGASIAVPVAAVGSRALTEVTEYAAPYFSREVANSALKVGDDFGRLGKVVSNPNLRIQALDEGGHFVDAAITRGVSPQAVLSTMRNPAAVLEQSRGRFLYISNDAAVVVTKEGKAITTYARENFDSRILDILKRAGGE